METFAELVKSGVIALATASYAQFGVQLERPPEPQPRTVQSVSRRRPRVTPVALVSPRAEPIRHT